MLPSSTCVFFLKIIVLFTVVFSSTAAILPAPPKVNAESYLVMDYESGHIIAGENITERVEPASLTKMMTTHVVAEELAAGNIGLEDEVVISEKAWRMKGSRMFIEVDTRVTVSDLLKGVIIQSGNDASVALAEYISGTEEAFASMMNEYARQLGMVNTNFMNSTGWPQENHYTTAEDMAALARALIREHPDIYSLHAIKEFTYNGIKQHNRNNLLWRDDSVDGIKTGHTENAGYCLVASAKRDNMRLISVVMGSDDENARIRATQSLLNFAFRFYETHKLYEPGQAVTTSQVWKGNSDTINLGVNERLWITVPRGSYDDLDIRTDTDKTIIAPVEKGAVYGKLVVSLDGRELAKRSLIALESINEGSLFERLKDEVRLLFQ
ncbi:MAG: D-alanyl-D-alanine carboxypeptidase family protein [Gammaproteobacteria bacterium]